VTIPTTRAECEIRDVNDPLVGFRGEFRIEPGLIYLDGNSLGALTHRAASRVQTMVESEWGRDLIRSWNLHGWFDLPARLGARIAPLIGAAADEVLVADSTSVNLFKLASAAMLARGERHRIVTEQGNFPTDLYVLQGLAGLTGGAIEILALPRAEIEAAIDRSTFLVVLTHVHYRSAEMFDLAAMTGRAHAVGARMLWDLSHSVGALPIELGAHRVDFAVGCTYKYLNGGPGAPAFLYVRRDLQDTLQPALAGWMGHGAPFDFADKYLPAAGVTRHRCGTPSLLAFAALEGALEASADADIRHVRAKSEALTELFIARVEALGYEAGLDLASPRRVAQRGSHVSFTHPRGYELIQALIDRGVIGDFRAPDVVRFGFAPLYLRYTDVWDAADAIDSALRMDLPAVEIPLRRGAVT
jgi:kynureninase